MNQGKYRLTGRNLTQRTRRAVLLDQKEDHSPRPRPPHAPGDQLTSRMVKMPGMSNVQNFGVRSITLRA